MVRGTQELESRLYVPCLCIFVIYAETMALLPFLFSRAEPLVACVHAIGRPVGGVQTSQLCRLPFP